jgi:hypothetical protein
MELHECYYREDINRYKHEQEGVEKSTCVGCDGAKDVLQVLASLNQVQHQERVQHVVPYRDERDGEEYSMVDGVRLSKNVDCLATSG